MGGYDDWLRQRGNTDSANREKTPVKSKKQPPRRPPKPTMSFNERRELKELPRTIENLETEQGRLYEFMSDPSSYRENGQEIAGAKARLESIERELNEAYQRWEMLDAKASGDS